METDDDDRVLAGEIADDPILDKELDSAFGNVVRLEIYKEALQEELKAVNTAIEEGEKEKERLLYPSGRP